MNPLALRAIGILAILAAIAGGLWYLYHSGYQAGEKDVQVKWDTDRIQRDQAQLKALLAYADQLKQAEVQHDQDQATIDDLHAAAGRMRVHLPACPGTAQTGPGADGAAGVLSSRVDESFGRLQDRVAELFRRCDQLNIDAIRANEGRP